MSEVNPDTTAVPLTNPVKTHVKDSRRVEAGRRLAMISKEAKARKKARLEAIMEDEENVLTEESKNDGSIVTLERVGLVVGIAVGLGSLYFMWHSSLKKDENPKGNEIVEEPEPVVIVPRGPDLFD
ncbi:Hypothetical predicted protein [Paramuricea clavata]|uniref:Uncharacterized protein n=1 Tax=Paramuricea clavata TaxID=317549 RepID=A0A6S7J956_PARCT|nr:Hypothetical predicted protein [Paramuricea clavata]